jgi:acylphosphatase
MTTHVNINIYGRVQRIGFRYHALKTARSLGLTGFVCNKDDGSVYAEAEGEEAFVMQFIDWCRIGPSMAIVEEVRTEAGEFEGFETFEIR